MCKIHFRLLAGFPGPVRNARILNILSSVNSDCLFVETNKWVFMQYIKSASTNQLIIAR